MNEITKELLEALKLSEEFLCGPTAWTQEQENNLVEKVSCAIAKAEAALAEPQADEDGWIPWSGGECPLDLLTQVDVRYRNGGELMGIGSTCLAGAYDWSHDERDYDIIAYRIVKESDK